MLNEASGARSNTASRNKKASSEHHLEVALSNDPRHWQAFGEHVEPIERLRRQLPVGLFEGSVAAKNAWLPRGSSQVDLWTTSTDGKTLHLFELKAARNVAVGIVPEALCYAWLLRHVACGLVDGRTLRGGGDALAAVRRASKVVMWLSAPRYHPLVWSEDDASHSPLAWINDGLSAFGIELRVLPLALEPGDAGVVRWVFGTRR